MAQPAKRNYGEPAGATRSLMSGNNFDFGYGDWKSTATISILEEDG